MPRRARGGGGRSEFDQQLVKPKSMTDESFQLFTTFRSELDSRHDKFERVLKASRDVTIESKRVIFSLHRLPTVSEESEKERIRNDVSQMLSFILKDLFARRIAQELCVEEDQWLFHRAYSPGLQEFIEAVSFKYYVEHDALLPFPDLAAMLRIQLPVDVPNNTPVTQTEEAIDHSRATEPSSAAEPEPSISEAFQLLVPVSDYLLGIADLTGELMRLATYQLNSGNTESPMKLCRFVSDLLSGFGKLGSSTGIRELSRKLFTMKQSLSKIERTCYNIRLRSTEIPRHMLGPAIAMKMQGDRAPDRSDERERGVDGFFEE